MPRFLPWLCLFAFLALVAGCSDDSPSGPGDVVGESSLVLSRVSLAMVVGRAETVTIFATDPHGNRDLCTATCSNDGIASVTTTDSTLTVTGTGLGHCNVTVTSANGKTRTMPVQVYDPTVIDTGELLITYTDQFSLITEWNAGPGCGIWKPICPEGFHELGSFLRAPFSNIVGHEAVMVVKARPGSDAIAFTHDFDHVLNYSSRDFWRPVPPAGYVALGMVTTYMSAQPDSVACIREDLTAVGAAELCLYTFYAYNTWFSWWSVEQPVAGPHDGAYLAPGTFLYAAGDTPPTFDPTIHVLKVNLPLLSEAPAQSFMPTLEGLASPSTETAPIFAKAMMVPCTVVRDDEHADDMPWRIAHSPFYRLERHVYYKLLYHNYNQTSQVQTNTVVIRSGVTATESTTFHEKTGVEISFEAGVDLKLFSSKVTTTVSREFGYDSQTSVAELQEKEVSTSINTSPGKAAALWQEYNRYILYRHDGTNLQPVSAWEFGIDSYVTDEYPN